MYNLTIGTRLTFKKNSVNVNGAFYFQGGKTGTNVDLSANYFSLEAIYLADAGFEYLSGNDFLKLETPQKIKLSHHFMEPTINLTGTWIIDWVVGWGILYENLGVLISTYALSTVFVPVC